MEIANKGEEVTLIICCLNPDYKEGDNKRSKYMTLLQKKYDYYSYDFFNMVLDKFVREAVDLTKKQKLGNLENLDMSLAIWLKYEGRPVLGMSRETIRLLADHFLSIDFDPYENV